MKTLMTAAAAALGLAGLAFANGPSGHVYEITNGDASWTSTFAEDGGYASSLGAEGTWTFEDGTLCMQIEAEEGTQEICNAWESMEVGESMTTSDWSSDGTELTITRTS